MTNNVWERQTNEPERAFLRFQRYRDLGSKRSLRSLAQLEKVQLSAIASQSTKFNWQQRVTAWDAHLDRVSQQSQVDEIVDMKKRQISLALKAQRLAEQGLEILLNRIDGESAQLRTMDLSKLLDTGCRLERLNRDEPEQNLALTQPQNLELLDEQELETMRLLLAKAQGGPCHRR